MPKTEIQVGSTDQTITVALRDVNGSPLTGKAYNTSGLTCYYRKGATGAVTALTLATQTVTGAHSDGGFVELDATNMPGDYRLDLSDTMVAALGGLRIFFNGIAGMNPEPVDIAVVAYNPQDAVRMGMTALPNAAHDAAGGLTTLMNAIDDFLDTEVAAIKAKTDNLPTDPADQSAVEAAITAAAMTAAGIRTALGMASANLDTQLAALAGYIDTEVAAIYNRIGAPVGASLSADVAAVNALVTAAAIRAAIGLAAANLDTQVGDLPTNAELVAALAAADDAVLAAIATLQTYVDTEVAAIKAKTDNLPASPAATGDAMTLTGGAITTAAFAAETGLKPIRSGTAQAGGATSITLDAGASAVDDFYNDTIGVYITGGTGAGQFRVITDYVGATKVATVDAWITVPDNTSTFALLTAAGGGGAGGGGGGLTAAETRAAIGMAAADLDDQLQAIDGQLAALTAPTVTYTTPVAPVTGDVVMIAGDDYTVATGQPLPWALTGAPDLTGATVDVVRVDEDETSFGWSVTVLNAGEATQTIRAEVTGAQTAALGSPTGTYTIPFRIKATFAGGGQRTLVDAEMTIT